MAFKKQAARLPVPASPEALYPVLAHGPDAPRELWSRQADVLRAYDGLEGDPSDVAIELPTGAGKTLVGCLIAEWRRRKHGERVAYVSPTRQLAQQAAAQARLYGIPAVDLTGRHTKWNPADEVGFNRGDSVAFVTYSSVFNSLQERFLHDSAGALAVLAERIRTRLTQGAGRATRNSADYAAVLILGRDVANFCAKADVQAALHPEIRAEVAFGLENSKGMPAGEALDNLRHFSAQDEDWRDAEQEIIAAREATKRVTPLGTAELAASAPHEVAAVSAAWQGDWAKAIDEAGKALVKLAGGDETRPYQALWHYILASWAVIAARSGDRQRLEGIADAHFADARAAAAGTRRLSGLATSASQLVAGPPPEPADPLDAAAITQIASSPLRTKPGARFSAFLTSVTEGLAQDKAQPYEKALAGLGELAGATLLARTGGDAEPDSVWMFGRLLWVAFEAKTEAEPGGVIPAKYAREADSHLNYAEASTSETAPPASLAVMINPQEAIHHAAGKVSGPRLYLVTPPVIADIAGRLAAAWESIRTQTRGMQAAEAEQLIGDTLNACSALPSQWLPRLTIRRVAGG